jgi:hypothetical protein
MNNLEFLPLVIENIIRDYKAQMEHKEKMQKICKEINTIHYTIGIGCGGLDMSVRHNKGLGNGWVRCHNFIGELEIYSNQKSTVISESISEYNDDYLHHIDDYPEIDFVNDPYYRLDEEDDEDFYVPKRRFYIH